MTELSYPVIYLRMKHLIASFLLGSVVAMVGPAIVNADPATKPCEEGAKGYRHQRIGKFGSVESNLPHPDIETLHALERKVTAA